MCEVGTEHKTRMGAHPKIIQGCVYAGVVYYAVRAVTYPG
jgi:hypothetical protein